MTARETRLLLRAALAYINATDALHRAYEAKDRHFDRYDSKCEAWRSEYRRLDHEHTGAMMLAQTTRDTLNNLRRRFGR